MGQRASRQDIIHEEVSDLRMRNWLCANVAMREASKCLAVCIHEKISQMHKELSRAVGRGAACTRNCSRSEREWCGVCIRWSREIIGICEPSYRQRINWSRLNSAQWSANPYEVARALIPKAHRLYYKCSEFHEDYRFSLSFIENCVELAVSRSLCEKLWQFRSRLKRKNGNMRMGTTELENGISLIVSLLSIPSLGSNNQVTVEKLRTLTQVDESDFDSSNNGGCLIM